MNTVQRIAKNTGVFLTSQIISFILGFFTILYSARYLGVEGFGILSIALAFTGIFGILSDLGLSTLTTREIARDKSKSNKYLFNTGLIKLVLACLTVIVVVFVVNLVDYSPDIKNIIYIITFSVILGSFSGIFYSLFQAYEKVEYQSIGQIIYSILILSGVLLAIYYRAGVYGVSLVYLFTSIIILIYSMFIFIWKFFMPRVEIDFSFWKPTLKEALPFGITSFTGSIYIYVDSVILSILQSTEVVGWYNAAYKLLFILVFIPGAVNVAIFPVMSRLHSSSDQNNLRYIYERYFKYMLILGIPIGFGTTILANKIILLIFGPQYSNSALVLQILIWTIVFTFAGAAFIKLFESINRQLTITKITGICMVINIFLNLILIPKFSYIGASFSTVITEIIMVGTVFWVSGQIGYDISRNKIFKIIFKVIFASIIMGLFLYYLLDLNLLVLIIFASLIYLGVLYLIKGIDDEDIKVFKRIFYR